MGKARKRYDARVQQILDLTSDDAERGRASRMLSLMYRQFEESVKRRREGDIDLSLLLTESAAVSAATTGLVISDRTHAMSAMMLLGSIDKYAVDAAVEDLGPDPRIKLMAEQVAWRAEQ